MSASPYTIAQIQQCLQQHFPAAQLQVWDESAAHAGHSGNPDGQALSHIRVRLRCSSLAGLSKVAQHRRLHTALQGFYAQGLHAVVLDTASA